VHVGRLFESADVRRSDVRKSGTPCTAKLKAIAHVPPNFSDRHENGCRRVGKTDTNVSRLAMSWTGMPASTSHLSKPPDSTPALTHRLDDGGSKDL
jgi:hypothetical protein